MMNTIPPRLRAPAKMAVLGAVALAIGGAVHGWVSVLYVASVLVVAAVGYYIWTGRDTDTAAFLRHQNDERQVGLQLKMQALVGKVMSAAVAVAYLVAAAAKITLWPFVVLVLLPAAALLLGWLMYREPGEG